jgi:hypothetical protein
LEGGLFYFTPAKRPVQDTVRKIPPRTVKPPAVTIKDTIVTLDSAGNVKDSVITVVKKPEVFVPSFYVYTNRDGYVFINLPDAENKKYRVRFFEMDSDEVLFELNDIRDKALTLDKANFIHSGWFRFELYNGDQLVERHRFYVPKDF